MINAGFDVYLVAEASKINKSSSAYLFARKVIQTVITEAEISDANAKAIETRRIEVLIEIDPEEARWR